MEERLNSHLAAQVDIVGRDGARLADDWVDENPSAYLGISEPAMAESGVAAVECPEELRTGYTREVDDLHEQLVWTHPGMTTYYRNRHGKVRSPMPFRLVDYWARTRSAGLDDFLLSR